MYYLCDFLGNGSGWPSVAVGSLVVAVIEQSTDSIAQTAFVDSSQVPNSSVFSAAVT